MKQNLLTVIWITVIFSFLKYFREYSDNSVRALGILSSTGQNKSFCHVPKAKDSKDSDLSTYFSMKLLDEADVSSVTFTHPSLSRAIKFILTKDLPPEEWRSVPMIRWRVSCALKCLSQHDTTSESDSLLYWQNLHHWVMFSQSYLISHIFGLGLRFCFILGQIID